MPPVLNLQASHFVVFPYCEDTKDGRRAWFFNDRRRNLVKESLHDTFDDFVSLLGWPNKRLRLAFGSRPVLGGSQVILDYGWPGDDGWWYVPRKPEGLAPIWLCPAMVRYFKFPPSTIYARLSPR